MNDIRRCPECGNPIPSGAPEGMCPKCLLAAGFESGGGPAGAAATQASPNPSGGFVPPEPEELAARFPQLEIHELLGKGGMGAVYKARQRELDRLVAVKILPPEISRDPTFAERFTREARALARLSHPNIVGVYDFGQTKPPIAYAPGSPEPPLFYIVMEYVDGVNLRQAIQAGSISPKEALAVVPQICAALQFAHDEGVVHRDIKPENILVDKRGRVKIADFGLAKIIESAASDSPRELAQLTATHQVMGTLRYMAPEQLEGTHAVDHRADIYSLGVVFYELLTGELPIGRFAAPSKKVQIDVRLDEVVLRALEKEPELRWQHASDVRTEVEAIVGAAPLPLNAIAPSAFGARQRSPRQSASTRPTTEPRFSRSAVVGAVWAPFLLIALGAMMFTWYEKREPTSAGSLEPAGPPLVVLVLASVLGLVGITAPFGTTILGFIAIGQIRRSEGNLHGLPLAVANALLYPLLLLDGLILVAFAALTMAILQAIYPGGPHGGVALSLPELITLLIALPTIAWVDYRIVRATWHAVTNREVPSPGTEFESSPSSPEASISPGYIRWVIAPMLGLFALWIGAAYWAAITYGPGSGGEYDPQTIIRVHLFAGLTVVLFLPTLLILRWAQTIPAPARRTLFVRFLTSSVAFVLASLGLLMYFVSPFNQPHVEAHGISLRPKSKTYEQLTLGVRFISHLRTESPYFSPDRCEIRVQVCESSNLIRGQGYMTLELPGPVRIAGDRREPFDHDRFIAWLRDDAQLPLDKPEVKQEAEELWMGIFGGYGSDGIPSGWDRLSQHNRGMMPHFEFGDDLGVKRYVQGNPSPWFLYAFGTIIASYATAILASLAAARRHACSVRSELELNALTRAQIAARVLTVAGGIQIVSAIATSLLLMGLIVDDSRFDAFFRSDEGRNSLLGAQGLGFLIGMLALVGGLALRVSQDAKLAKFAAFALLLPQSPAWVVTCPLAIWAITLLASQNRPNEDSAARAGDGRP